MSRRKWRVRWWALQQWWWNLRYPVSDEELQQGYEAIRRELWKTEHGWSGTRTLDE